MELLFHVIQFFEYGITTDHSNTINIGFVLITSVIVLVEQHENLQLLGV
jgi:hypothetical protein